MARLSMRCSEELLQRVDVARGDVARERWLRRAVERALATEPPGMEDARVSAVELPAPAEQPRAWHEEITSKGTPVAVPPERRVSPSGPLTLAEHNDAMLSSVPPGQSAVIPVYVSRRRDVKPFQRGGS